jgi:arabinan endo-1,5-alpha-L-arabinosidase
VKRVSLSALFLVLGGCQASTDVVARSYGDYLNDPNNLPYVLNINGDLATTDPSLFRWQGTYYVFSTGSTGSGVDLRSTKNLEADKFERRDQIFPSNPSWIAGLLPETTNLWSPYVLDWQGTIHMYYGASWFAAVSACIGHATTTSMDKPFVDDGQPVICSNLDTTDPYVAIDPAVILDDDGNPWMVFGSWGNGINLMALDRQGRRDPMSSPVVVAARAPGDSVAIQAASLYRWRDFYYLFVSYEYSPDHVLRVGRAKQVTGPYLDREGAPMVSGGGTLVLDRDATFRGPGSNMVFDDVDQRLNVYHAYNATDDVVLRIGQLFFDDDGWPVSAGP